MSNTRELILENLLTGKVQKHFRIAPQEKYEQVLKQIFEELEYEEFSEDSSIMSFQEILKVVNVFNLQIIGEGKDNKLNLKVDKFGGTKGVIFDQHISQYWH